MRRFGRFMHPYGAFCAPTLLAAAAFGLSACGSAATTTGTPTTSRASVALPPCPKNDHHLTFTHDDRTATTLVPAGATAVRLCTYQGLNPHVRDVGLLDTSRQVTKPAKVAALASLFNQLPPYSGNRRLIYCPMDDGSKAAALFDYAHAPIVTVAIHLTGCSFVKNGDQRRVLTRRLERAFRPT
jgi:hypothetical protein